MILDWKGSLSPFMKAKWPIFKLKTKVECHSGISETFKVLCLPFESCIANNCLYVITNNTILQPKKIFTCRQQTQKQLQQIGRKTFLLINLATSTTLKYHYVQLGLKFRVLLQPWEFALITTCQHIPMHIVIEMQFFNNYGFRAIALLILYCKTSMHRPAF